MNPRYRLQLFADTFYDKPGEIGITFLNGLVTLTFHYCDSALN